MGERHFDETPMLTYCSVTLRRIMPVHFNFYSDCINDLCIDISIHYSPTGSETNSLHKRMAENC